MNPVMRCPECGHQWSSRTERPSRCPGCFVRLRGRGDAATAPAPSGGVVAAAAPTPLGVLGGAAAAAGVAAGVAAASVANLPPATIRKYEREDAKREAGIDLEWEGIQAKIEAETNAAWLEGRTRQHNQTMARWAQMERDGLVTVERGHVHAPGLWPHCVIGNDGLCRKIKRVVRDSPPDPPRSPPECAARARTTGGEPSDDREGR